MARIINFILHIEKKKKIIIIIIKPIYIAHPMPRCALHAIKWKMGIYI